MHRIHPVLVTLLLFAAACDPTVPPLPVIEHEGGTIDAPETWEAATHLLKGSLTLNATLTVPACSVIKMPNAGTITVTTNGALKLLGTANCPVRVTSSKSTGSPGDWQYLEFYTGSVGPENVIQHAIIEFGGADAYGAIWLDGGASLEVSNTVLQQNRGAGLFAENDAELRNFNGNSFIGNRGFAMVAGVNVAGDLYPGTFTDNGTQAVKLTGGTIEVNDTWRPIGVPFVAESFSIEAASGSATLTIAAGTTVKMEPNTSITVSNNGGLTLAGTAAAPVTLTSSKAAPAAGDWVEIDFYGNSIDNSNVISHAVIEYAGGTGNYGALWLQNGASVAINNTTIRNSSAAGIYVADDDARLRGFVDNTIINCAKEPIHAMAGMVADIGAGVYAPNGIDGIAIHGGTVTRTETWADRGVRYLVAGSFGVDPPSGTATLTVAAGVTLAMDAATYITIYANGRLNLAGVSGNRVTVTSDEPAPSPGDWVEIDLYSLGNTFSYTDIRYGGGSNYGQVWVGSNAALSLDNVAFSQSGDVCDVDVASGGTLTPTASTYVLCPP